MNNISVFIFFILSCFLSDCQKKKHSTNESGEHEVEPAKIIVRPGQFVPIDRSEFNQNLRTGLFFVYPDNHDSVYSEMHTRNKQTGILVPLLADSSGEGFFTSNICVRYAEYYFDEVNPRPKPDIYSLRTLKTEIWRLDFPDTLQSAVPGKITKLFLNEIIKKVRPSSCYKNEISYENVRFTARLIDSSVACNYSGDTGKETKKSILIKMQHIRYADYFIAYALLGEELHELTQTVVEDSVRSKLDDMNEWSIRPIMSTLHGAGRISRELTRYRTDCLE